MSFKIFAAVTAMALAATACQQIPEDMTVAQFCAQPDKANTDVCKINVEIDGQRQALSQTDMRLGDAPAPTRLRLRLTRPRPLLMRR